MQPGHRAAKVFGDPTKAKILVIGHDPALQKSDTIAEFCFFADYYFKEKPKSVAELRKYGLASALFNYIEDLTEGRYSSEQILITNLCNEQLPHLRGTTVLIPREKALQGIREIRSLLAMSEIEWVFAMSQQVNYWLQELGFCPATPQYLADARPKDTGLKNNPPYYKPQRGKAFLQICGNPYTVDNERILFPILHVKNWPLPANFRPYEPCYARYRNTFHTLLLERASKI